MWNFFLFRIDPQSTNAGIRRSRENQATVLLLLWKITSISFTENLERNAATSGYVLVETCEETSGRVMDIPVITFNTQV